MDAWAVCQCAWWVREIHKVSDLLAKRERRSLTTDRASVAIGLLGRLLLDIRATRDGSLLRSIHTR
jgi:hypothetical protein